MYSRLRDSLDFYNRQMRYMDKIIKHTSPKQYGMYIASNKKKKNGNG